MPLLKTRKVTEDKMWAAWDLTEDLDELYSMVDLEKEEHTLDGISHPHKKQEWLGSRILAETLCMELGIPYFGIKKDEYGKPWLKDQPYFISVSHKYPYVAVLVDKKQQAGIDIEPVREKNLRIAPKFLSDKESQWANSPLFVTLAWAAKEALYKVHGRKQLIFKEQLLLDFLGGNASEGDFFGKIINDEPMELNLHYECIHHDLYVVFTV